MRGIFAAFNFKGIDKSFLDKILLEGQKKANDYASKKIKNMKEIVGF